MSASGVISIIVIIAVVIFMASVISKFIDCYPKDGTFSIQMVMDGENIFLTDVNYDTLMVMINHCKEKGLVYTVITLK